MKNTINILLKYVGELARNIIFGRFGIKSNIDANTLTETGGYYLTTEITNASGLSYLVSFRLNASTCFQLNVDFKGTWIKMRCLQDTGAWSEWKSFQII